MQHACIMVVEDERIVAEDIRERLTRLGFTAVDGGSSAEDAIRIASQELPNLVLMDIRLRGRMDGIEGAAQIRTRFDIPVVFLTAHWDENTLMRAKITEPFGYILKPFQDRELKTVVDMALYKHAMMKKLRESEQWFATTLKSIGDAVIATDRMGVIKFMNPAAETVTGWKQSAAIGKNSADFLLMINKATREVVASPVLEAQKAGVVVTLPPGTLLVTRDGAEQSIAGTTAPIRDAKEEVIGFVLVFRNGA